MYVWYRLSRLGSGASGSTLWLSVLAIDLHRLTRLYLLFRLRMALLVRAIRSFLAVVIVVLRTTLWATCVTLWQLVHVRQNLSVMHLGERAELVFLPWKP